MNPYETLGVAKDATDMQIKRAYRKLAQKFHPDISTEPNAEAKFKEVKAAYELLSDPERRAYFDATGNVEGNALDPVRDALMMVMHDALVISVQLPNVDIWATTKHGLDQAHENGVQRILELQKVLVLLKRRRGALRRKYRGKRDKEDRPNLFTLVVDKEIEEVEDLVRVKIPKVMDYISGARKLFNDYEKGDGFEVEEAVRRIGFNV